MIELRERDIREFFEVPFHAYGKDSLYVSPFKADLERFLDGAKNPLFKRYGEFTFFTARKNARPVGRIVAHIHRLSNERHGWKRASFGYFDCADDPKAALMLLRAAEAWGRERGCTEIMGNFNLTAMQQMGVVTGGFEHAPYTDQIYNPPHIPELLKANRYEATFPMTTFEVDLRKLDPETLLPPGTREKLAASGLVWKQLRKREFSKMMRDMTDVLNAGFDQNPMFVPVTYEESLFQAKDMMWIIDERISSIVYRDEKPVGVTICIPDLNPVLKQSDSRLKPGTLYHFLRYRLNRKRAIAIFSSVIPELHGQGLAPSMLYRMTRALKDAGYETMGITWVADVNKASLRVVEKLGGKPMHRCHLFRKDL